MASLHDRRAHEQRYVNANRLIVQQTSRAFRGALRVGRGLRGWLKDEQDSGIVGGVYPAFASKILNLREEGALVRRETRQKLVW